MSGDTENELHRNACLLSGSAASALLLKKCIKKHEGAGSGALFGRLRKVQEMIEYYYETLIYTPLYEHNQQKKHKECVVTPTVQQISKTAFKHC